MYSTGRYSASCSFAKWKPSRDDEPNLKRVINLAKPKRVVLNEENLRKKAKEEKMKLKTRSKPPENQKEQNTGVFNLT